MNHVIMSISGRGFGGSKQVFLNYIPILEKVGYTVILLIRKNSAVHKKILLHFPHLVNNIEFIKYHRIDIPYFSKKAILQYKHLYSKYKPSIIIVHKSIDAYFAKISDIPCKILGVAHGFLSKTQLYHIKYSDIIIAVSNTVSEYIKKYLPNNKIEVIYNFIDFVDNIHTDDNIEPNHEVLTLGTMCVFRRKKNIPLLLKACYLLKKEGIEHKLVIAGKGMEKLKILFLIIFYGLNNHVFIEGWVEDKQKFFSKIDIFVVTSNTESFNMTLIEAMVNSIPVISTKCGGPNEIIEHNKTGLLVPTKSPKALAEALKMLINNAYLRAQLAKAGRESSINKFSSKKVELFFNTMTIEQEV